MSVIHRQRHTGRDEGLVPLRPLDLSKVTSVDELVRAMSETAFGGRSLGEAADVLEAMIRDRDCVKVITLSGAMTVAKQGLVLTEMIERGWVDIVISTGALMAHGFIEDSGLNHYKYQESMDDKALFELGYNRVYDTLEPESNFDESQIIFFKVIDSFPEGETLSSAKITRALGAALKKRGNARAILRAAHDKDVPVYVPAFTDSALGLDFSVNNRRRHDEGRPRYAYDPFLDLEDYAARVRDAKEMGIFTVGGGVPRNWAQQIGPYLDILRNRVNPDEVQRRFKYAVRICPEPVHWGGLSGCSYSEGVSWGKFVPAADGGRFAEVFADATIAWPLVVRAVMERFDSR